MRRVEDLSTFPSAPRPLGPFAPCPSAWRRQFPPLDPAQAIGTIRRDALQGLAKSAVHVLYQQGVLFLVQKPAFLTSIILNLYDGQSHRSAVHLHDKLIAPINHHPPFDRIDRKLGPALRLELTEHLLAKPQCGGVLSFGIHATLEETRVDEGSGAHDGLLCHEGGPLVSRVFPLDNAVG